MLINELHLYHILIDYKYLFKKESIFQFIFAKKYMLKPFIYFFIGLIVIHFVTSFTNKTSEEDLIKLDYVINQNKDINDSVLLKKNFETLSNSSSSYIQKNLNVIYSILLAEAHYKSIDKINSKSDLLFRHAKETTKELNNPGLTIWVNTKIGFYYYNFSEYQKAFPYFMFASRLLDTNKPSDIIQKSYVYKTNAYFFGNVGDVEKSKNYLKSALSFTNKTSNEYASILNAIGQIYYDKKDFDSAEHYYLLAQKNALKNNDQLRYAKVLGDLSLIYNHRKEYDKAIDLLQKDIEISEKLNEERNLMFANIRLGKIYLDQGKYTEAKETIKNAEKYASTKEYLRSFELEINTSLLQIAIKEKNQEEELRLRRKINDIQNLLKNKNGEDVIDQINWNIQKKNFDYQLEAQKTKADKADLLRNALIIISILLLLIAVFIYLSFSRKIKIQNSLFENKVLQLRLQKLESENALNHTTKSLDDYKIFLTEKNRQIGVLKQEIETIQQSNQIFGSEKNKGKLNQLLHSHLMTEENWTNFKTIFSYEQKDFCEYLNANFPNLTDSNLRIIFLQKLGLNNVETSQILGITTDAVKKAKQRLKKKYENFDTVFSDFTDPE